MMGNVFFSICVPVYNAETYLRECVSSVLNQSYRKFELILVDDGSTDCSYRLCEELQMKDCRIKAFTKENGGQISAREFAFAHATGNVILCVDADDFIESNALEKLNDYFQKYNCDCIYFNYQRFYNNKVVGTNTDIRELEIVSEKKDLYKKICLNSCFNAVWRKAFKREFIPLENLSQFYRIRLGEDLLQTLFIHKKMSTILFTPDVLYNYRINLASVSNSNSGEGYEPGNFVRFFVYNFLKEENLFSKQDWSDYSTYCANLFYADILKITTFKCSFKKKFYLLKAERNSQYYNDFLFGVGTQLIFKNILLGLIKVKCYVGVIFLGRVYGFVYFFKRRFLCQKVDDKT